MQARHIFEQFIHSWTHGEDIDNGIGQHGDWSLPVPDELGLTESEIEDARPSHSMTLLDQMANLAVEIRQQRWYAEAIQRKFCSCHIQRNIWFAD